MYYPGSINSICNKQFIHHNADFRMVTDNNTNPDENQLYDSTKADSTVDSLRLCLLFY